MVLSDLKVGLTEDAGNEYRVVKEDLIYQEETGYAYLEKEQ